jgi:fructose-1-phosphate kinase PfkB-like protein
LLRALDAAPDLVTPNLAEAEGALGLGGGGASVASGPDARPRALAAAEALLRQGAGAAVVTADAAGAAVCFDGGAEWLPAPRVAEVRNPIGAGDVLLSALAGALEQGSELLVAARASVAAASASVEHPTGGMLDPERARVLAAGMKVNGGH